MKLNPRGMAFWLAWGALGGLWELAMVVSGHADLTLSWQVWTIIAWAPTWLNALGLAGFGAAASVLAWHFWGKR